MGGTVALLDRGFVQLEGPDALSFLQGLTTNDTTLLGPDSAQGAAACQYTSMLHPKGRVLWEMFAWAHPHGVLLDCDSAAASAVLKRLTTFKLRADVEITDVSTEWSACALLGMARPANAALPPQAAVVLDPRCSALGYRAIVPAGATAAASADGAATYTALRRRLGIAEGIAEIVPDKFFPSELNLERLSGVSFTKGCYVGQELTARTHFTGEVRKRVLPCFLSPPAGCHEVPMDDADRRQVQVVNEEGAFVKGRKGAAGLLLENDEGGGSVVLASLRLERALDPEVRISTADGRGVLPYLPHWWAASERAALGEKEAAAASQKVMAAEAATLKAHRAMEALEAELTAQAAAEAGGDTVPEGVGDEPGEDEGPLPCDDARYVGLFESSEEQLASLETLDMSSCAPMMNDLDLEDCLDVLESAGILREIDLSGNELSDECLQPLCMMLARGGAPALARVDLRGNAALSTELAAEMGAGVAMMETRPNFEFVVE